MRLEDADGGADVVWHPPGSPLLNLYARVTGRRRRTGRVTLLEVLPHPAGCSPQWWPADTPVEPAPWMDPPRPGRTAPRPAAGWPWPR